MNEEGPPNRELNTKEFVEANTAGPIDQTETSRGGLCHLLRRLFKTHKLERARL